MFKNFQVSSFMGTTSLVPDATQGSPPRSLFSFPNVGKWPNAAYSVILEGFQPLQQYLVILIQIFGFITLKGVVVGGK